MKKHKYRVGQLFRLVKDADGTVSDRVIQLELTETKPDGGYGLKVLFDSEFPENVGMFVPMFQSELDIYYRTTKNKVHKTPEAWKR